MHHRDTDESIPSARCDIDRLASLVAEGAVPFPAHLAAGQRSQLWQLVSQRRRERLIQWFARAIAEDIQRSRRLEDSEE